MSNYWSLEANIEPRTFSKLRMKVCCNHNTMARGKAGKIHLISARQAALLNSAICHRNGPLKNMVSDMETKNSSNSDK